MVSSIYIIVGGNRLNGDVWLPKLCDTVISMRGEKVADRIMFMELLRDVPENRILVGPVDSRSLILCGSAIV